MEKREDLALVPFDQVGVGLLVPVGAAVLHAVFLGEPLDLAVAEHGQARQGGHQDADAEVLVALAELVDGGVFVGVVHEIDKAFEDLRVELEGVLHDRAVLGVVLVAQHIHEGAVVDAVHAQGAHEVAFHQPEGFGQEQRVGHLLGNAVDHLTPELTGNSWLNSALGHAVFGAGGNVAAAARLREPEPLEVFFGEGHGGVEADDREAAGDAEDGLDDGFAHFGIR